MQKPTLFGLEITLTCPKCQKECPMSDPSGLLNTTDRIRKAYMDHHDSNCQPPGCEFCGGTDSLEDRIHSLYSGGCIKHLRKLVVDLYNRLPASPITYSEPENHP